MVHEGNLRQQGKVEKWYSKWNLEQGKVASWIIRKNGIVKQWEKVEQQGKVA